MVDSRASSLPSIVSTLAERLDCSSSSPVIVEKFVETLIPLDADGEVMKTNDGLEISLALTNPEESLQVRDNHSNSRASDLNPRVKRELKSTSNLRVTTQLY